MKDRIRQIMEAQHMTQQTFARFIEVSPASLSSIFQGRTKPTLNIVESIKGKLTDINTDWLLFGKGRMYLSDQSTDMSDGDVAIGNASNELFPVLDAPVAAGVSSVNSADAAGSLLGESVLDFSESSQQPVMRGRKTVPGKAGAAGRMQSVAVKKTDKMGKCISEIRVYYDDNTFEVFAPQR